MKHTAPSFPLHAGDWFKGTASLRPAERGFYLDLLLYQWDADAPIPEDEHLQMQIARCTNVREWRAAWAVLQAKFQQVPGGWKNHRVEAERARMIDNRTRKAASGAKGAAKRWQTDGRTDGRADGKAIAEPMANVCPPLPLPLKEQDVPQEIIELVGAAAGGPDRRLVLCHFPVKGGEHPWPLTAEALAPLIDAYPTLDVSAECLQAKAWLEANPQRLKTARGLPRFLNAWLSRSQRTRAQSRPRNGSPRSAGMGWFDDCKRLHGGACENQQQHHIRVDREALQETPHVMASAR